MSAVNVKRRRSGSRQQQVLDMNFMKTNVQFPSFPGKFRVQSNSTQEGLSFKLEKLKSPQQWQATITDISKHGVAGIPKEAVFSTFKAALESQITPDADDDESSDVAAGEEKEEEEEEKEEKEEEDKEEAQSPKKAGSADQAKVDVEIGEDGMLQMYLDIPVAGTEISYVFEFLPIARESIDVLESALHDAQEEIEKLRKQVVNLKKISRVPTLITLYLLAPCQPNQYAQWSTLRNTNPKSFTLEQNNQHLIVKESGFYQVSVRLSSNDSSGNRNVSLMSNGVVLATAYCGMNTGYQNSVYINDIVFLDANSNLLVHNKNGNQATVPDQSSNVFSVLQL